MKTQQLHPGPGSTDTPRAAPCVQDVNGRRLLRVAPVVQRGDFEKMAHPERLGPHFHAHTFSAGFRRSTCHNGAPQGQRRGMTTDGAERDRVRPVYAVIGCALLTVAGCVVEGDTGTLPTPPIDTAWIGGGAGNVSAEVLEAGPLPCEQELELDPPELTLGAAGAAAATVHGCAQGVAAQCDVELEALVEPELREGDVVGVRLTAAAPASGEGVCLVRWGDGETTQVVELRVRW